MRLVNQIGKQFGRLLVVKQADYYTQPNGRKRVQWLCRCSCGNEIIVESGNLSTGHTLSCGCLVKDNCAKIGKANKSHGKKGSKEWFSWRGMKNSCLNKNAQQYLVFKKLGITICDRWIDSFENFYSDMGDKPEGFCLTRLDPTKGYYPENVAWVEQFDVKKYRRNIIKVRLNGVEMTLMDACRISGIHRDTVISRIESGVPEEFLFVKNLPWSNRILDTDKAVFYIYESEKFLGFGISKRFTARNYEHITNAKKHNATLKLIKIFSFSGKVVKELEKEIKMLYSDKILDTGIPGFRTEAIPIKYKVGFPEICEILINNRGYK